MNSEEREEFDYKLDADPDEATKAERAERRALAKQMLEGS